MHHIPAADLKTYIHHEYPYLAPQLGQCETSDDILCLISNECSLTDLSLLESVINHFKIEEAQLIIQQYKEKVDEFCDSMLFHSIITGHLSSNKITFLVHKNVTNNTLRDIKELIRKKLSSLNSHVKVDIIRK